MASFDDYFALHEKGAYREAYDVLRDIMEQQPQWSSVGDMRVWRAELELSVNQDIGKTVEILDEARELGCSDMANYYRVRGFVLWPSGDHYGGRQCFEKSIELNPSITNLVMMGKFLTSDRAKTACTSEQK